MVATSARPPLLPGRLRSTRLVDAGAVFATAFVVRMAYLLGSSGGLGGNFGYDAGVYYTASSSLLHGDLPYADFTLLHPPGIVLALTPFAAIGRATSDHLGFELATVAFVVIASVNATLVGAIVRRCGLSRQAALLGGLFYALWFGAVGAEVSARLEPLASLAFLCGLLVLVGSDVFDVRRTLCGGVLIGLAATVKIWWIVPALVVLAWHLTRPARRRGAAPFAAGVVLGLSLVIGPFFLAAPDALWRMVVTDQLGRHRSRGSTVLRFDQLTSLLAAHVPASRPLVGALAGLVLVLCWRAWGLPVGRLVVGVLAAQAAVLVAAPTYFPFYSGYLAPAAALVVAFAGHRQLSVRAGAWASRTAVAGAATLTLCALVVSTHGVTRPFPARQLAGSVRGVRCLMTDSPMALIELNALTRDLDHRCPNWVDVSGRTYDIDAPPDGRPVRRRDNQRWQADIGNYLRAGDAAVVIRSGTGIDRATRREIESGPVLSRADGVTVYRTGS